MINDNKIIPVRNLMGYNVVFKDEDTRRRIVFQPYETKKIDAGTLRRLNYSRGGNVLLKDFLSVGDQELAEEFDISADSFEHEYQWTIEDIDNVLNNGSIDELKDALDFAPDGIIQMIVDRAVENKLNNIQKREVIQEMTGFDITAKIRNKEAYEQSIESDTTKKEPKQRRVSDSKEESNSRRTS